MDKKTVKKLWMNIAKKEIPRIFKYFDKVRNDNQQNTSKYVQACSKEERKKVQRGLKLIKDAPIRAKKLQREMLYFWKKKEKEYKELKSKKDRAEREIKKKVEEQKEAMLNKKRLEYIMRQSEAYTSGMASKIGMSVRQEKKQPVFLNGEEV